MTEKHTDKRTILIVDDDADLSMLIQDMLEDNGYAFLYAASIDDAYEVLTDNKCDLILLDINLPDGTGFSFCKELRHTSQVPIIFASARTSEDDKVNGLDMGGDDYITKPIRVKELVSRINAVLRRKRIVSKKEENSNKIISEDITIELLKYKVYKKEEVIDLTTIEYKLLLLLIKNNGNVLERNLLLERLWDTDGNFVDGNALTVYIKRLREKVEDDIKNPTYIETVRGIGYRWSKEAKEV